MIQDHQDRVEQNPTHTKFKISHSKDKYQEVLSYNELMDHLNQQEEGPLEWEMKRIVSHQGPSQKNTLATKDQSIMSGLNGKMEDHIGTTVGHCS